MQAIANDPNIPVKNNLIGPSVATGAWTPEMVWDTGFITPYSNSLSALAVEQQVAFTSREFSEPDLFLQLS